MDFLLTNVAPLAGLMLATGIIGGILAGLLGIGGGIVIVPVLEFSLGILGVDPDIRMHIAVATSLATIVPTAISSARSHHRRGAVDLGLARAWALPILVGALTGAYIASRVQSDVLAIVFAIVALLVAVKMILPTDHITLAPAVPRTGVGWLMPFSIGTVSTMMGIGGGTLSVSTLTLFSLPIHRAIGTAALFGLLIAVPGMIGFMISGYGIPNLPVGSIGYVNLIGFALISPATYFAAPLGARIAHALSHRQLSLLFGLFLLAVACRMFYRAMIA